MRLAWLTDTHLNFIRFPESWWLETIQKDVDAYVITGDITTARDIPMIVRILAKAEKPVYIVLGNHDFWGSSIREVREDLQKMLSGEPEGKFVRYMTVEEDPILLTSGTALIGDDGWYDGRNGRYHQSDVFMVDLKKIRDFSRMRGDRMWKTSNLILMQKLADASAERVVELCKKATEREETKNLIIATHVPPFAESSWHEGGMSNDDFLPFFSSKIMGESIVDATVEFRVRGGKVLVLCGHSHGSGVYKPVEGLVCKTGGAVYGQPRVEEIFDVDLLEENNPYRRYPKWENFRM
jgi:Icc protein